MCYRIYLLWVIFLIYISFWFRINTFDIEFIEYRLFNNIYYCINNIRDDICFKKINMKTRISSSINDSMCAYSFLNKILSNSIFCNFKYLQSDLSLTKRFPNFNQGTFFSFFFFLRKTASIVKRDWWIIFRIDHRNAHSTFRFSNSHPWRYTRVAGNQIREYDILYPALITTIPHLNPYANVTSKISERAIPSRGVGGMGNTHWP